MVIKRPNVPELRIDVGADEHTPLLGAPASAPAARSPSRPPYIQNESLDAQIHAPAFRNAAPMLAVPATRQVAADYDEPLSAKSYDESLRRSTSLLDDKANSEPSTRLPRRQILLLCYARMIEPIAFFSIFPFINKMIWETGNIKESDVGFYSGLIESLFSLTQMMLMIPWGHAADRFGRKPILYFSLLGTGFATMLFGFSKTIWQMVLFRCLAGMFAGSVVTIRAMFSENSTPETQARAFSYFAFSGNIGVFIGPFIGGGLSNPADQYPWLFGNSVFLREYPYALATVVSGLFSISAAVATMVSVKETLRSKDRVETAAKPVANKSLFKSPGVLVVLYIYTHVMFLAFAYTAVVPVFWFTAPELGGYGFSPLQISIYLGSAGIAQAIWTLLVFPRLQKKIGTGGVLRSCFALWPVLYAGNALGNYFRRNHDTAAFWTVVPLNLLMASGISMSYTGVQLALNDVAPSHATLGTLNAIALALASGSRALTPAVFASVFAIGVRERILGGQLVWLVMGALAIMLRVITGWLPERAQGRPTGQKPADADPDEEE